MIDFVILKVGNMGMFIYSQKEPSIQFNFRDLFL